MNNHMEKRMAQLAWVVERIDTGKSVDTLRLADAVQLCDESYTLNEVIISRGSYQERAGWELLRGVNGVRENLFPSIREGFIWLARYLLAHPPREKQSMFPYFNVFTGVVIHDQPHVPRRVTHNKPKYAARSGAYEKVLPTKEGHGLGSESDARGHRGAIGVLLGEKRGDSSPFSAVEGLARSARTKRGDGPIG